MLWRFQVWFVIDRTVYKYELLLCFYFCRLSICKLFGQWLVSGVVWVNIQNVRRPPNHGVEKQQQNKWKKKTKLNGTVCGFELDNGKWMSNRFVFGMAHFASFICSFNFRAFMYTFGGDLVSNWIVSQPTKIKNTTSKGGCQHLSQLLLIWNGNWLWSDRNVCRLTSYQ